MTCPFEAQLSLLYLTRLLQRDIEPIQYSFRFKVSSFIEVSICDSHMSQFMSHLSPQRKAPTWSIVAPQTVRHGLPTIPELISVWSPRFSSPPSRASVSVVCKPHSYHHDRLNAQSCATTFGCDGLDIFLNEYSVFCCTLAFVFRFPSQESFPYPTLCRRNFITTKMRLYFPILDILFRSEGL